MGSNQISVPLYYRQSFQFYYEKLSGHGQITFSTSWSIKTSSGCQKSETLFMQNILHLGPVNELSDHAVKTNKT